MNTDEKDLLIARLSGIKDLIMYMIEGCEVYPVTEESLEILLDIVLNLIDQAKTSDF